MNRHNFKWLIRLALLMMFPVLIACDMYNDILACRT